MAVTLVQVHYRFRTDTATVETAPTWGAAEDTAWSIFPGTFRLRVEVQNTGSTQSANQTWSIYAQKNGAGGYTAVTTTRTDGIKAVDAGASADNDTLSTRRLTAASGTWQSGQYDETGATGTQRIYATSVTEFEFGLALDLAALNPNDYFDLRVYGGTSALNTYSVTPRITASFVALKASGENLLAYSTTFENAAWTKSNVDATFATQQTFGNRLFRKLAESTTASVQHINYASASNAAGSVTWSCYVHAAERTRIEAFCANIGWTKYVQLLFNIASGAGTLVWSTAVGTGVSIAASGAIDCGNDVWRIWFTMAGADASMIAGHYLDNGSGNGAESTTYAGTVGYGAWIADAQISDGAALGSYQTTNGTTATGGCHQVGSPAIEAPALGQASADNLTAAGLTIGAPAIGGGAIGQEHILAADGLSTGVPIVPAAVLAGIDGLSAADLAVAAAMLDAPAILSVLVAGEIVTGAAMTGAGIFAQTHAFIANEIAAGTPVIAAGEFALAVDLLGTAIAIGAPTLGSATLAEANTLAAADVATGAPELTAPLLAPVFALIAENLAIVSPLFTGAAIGQIHALATGDVAAGAPVLAAPGLGIGAVDLAAADLILSSPSIAAPTMTAFWAFDGAALAAGAPTIESSVIGQGHALGASMVAAGAPMLAAGDLDIVGQPVAGPLVVGASVIAGGAFDQNHTLAALALAAGPPVLGTPDFARLVFALDAEPIIVPSLDIGRPSIGQDHQLAAFPLVLHAPVLGIGTLSFASVSRGIAFTGHRHPITFAGQRATVEIIGGRSPLNFAGQRASVKITGGIPRPNFTGRVSH